MKTRFKVNLMYQVELSTDWSMRINYIRFKKSKRHRSCFYSNSISPTSRRRHYAILKAHDLWCLCFLTFFSFLFSSFSPIPSTRVYELEDYSCYRHFRHNWKFYDCKICEKLYSDKSLIFFEHTSWKIFSSSMKNR